MVKAPLDGSTESVKMALTIVGEMYVNVANLAAITDAALAPEEVSFDSLHAVFLSYSIGAAQAVWHPEGCDNRFEFSNLTFNF